MTWEWIIQYYKLFNTPDISTICQQETGLTVDQIYLIGMALLGNFLSSARIFRKMNIQIPDITEDHFDHFLRMTASSRPAMAERLRQEHALDETFAYRYSSLREFPLITFSYEGKDEIACPIPTLLFWRMTTGLYYSLREHRGFPTAFGESFQEYVGEVLHGRIIYPGMNVLGEDQYHVGRHRKDTVDWIIAEGEAAALFIECKTMRLTWASKAGLSDLSDLSRDIRKLAGAIVQVYKTVKDYRQGLYPHLHYRPDRRVYPVVVTLEDWFFFGNELLPRLEVAVK